MFFTECRVSRAELSGKDACQNTGDGGLHLALVCLCVEGVVTVHATLSQVLKTHTKRNVNTNNLR